MKRKLIINSLNIKKTMTYDVGNPSWLGTGTKMWQG
jgi:hypothetical protein